jgi:hypothetical protein
MMFQLDTAGVGFDGKVKSIGRSEQMERKKVENTGIGLIIICIESDTLPHGPKGSAEFRKSHTDPFVILGVNVVCRLFAFPKVPPFDGLTDQVPVLAPPLIVPLIGMVVPAQIVVSFPALTTGFTKNVTVKESFTALHGPTGLMDVSVSVTLEFAIS